MTSADVILSLYVSYGHLSDPADSSWHDQGPETDKIVRVTSGVQP